MHPECKQMTQCKHSLFKHVHIKQIVSPYSVTNGFSVKQLGAMQTSGYTVNKGIKCKQKDAMSTNTSTVQQKDIQYQYQFVYRINKLMQCKWMDCVRPSSMKVTMT